MPKKIEKKAQEEVRGKKETYEVCVAVDEALRKEKGGVVKRRLVSLNEANEVARRLAVAKGESRRVGVRGGKMEQMSDEIDEWMP